MTKRSLENYEQDMAAIVRRSHGLWYHVNQAIHKVVIWAVDNHKDRQWVYYTLMASVGPEEKDEPVSINNARLAAKQILKGEGKLTLI